MNYGRKYVVRCPKAGTFMSVPPTKKGGKPVLGPLAEARFYPDKVAAQKAAEGWGGEATPVDLTVNTSCQVYLEVSEGRFQFTRNGASCDPPAWWRTTPAAERTAALAATGWVRAPQ